MLKYRPFEMHCHTRHSDGTFWSPQLIEVWLPMDMRVWR